MRRLVEHGSKSEELTVPRFVNDDFLMILVDGRDADPARYHDVGSTPCVARLVDPLAGRKRLQLDLTGEHGGFLFVEESEEGNVLQLLRSAAHD